LIVLNYLKESNIKPEWMAIRYLPVLPPELRPIIKLQDSTIVSSTFNKIYEKIINTNNKICKLKNLQVSSLLIDNEKLKLQKNIEILISDKEEM
jgi:DNA-directed RNA polymerase subunit beta'